MKTAKFILNLMIILLGPQMNAFAQEMQHGFILSNNDTLGSHLVANGHHSRQVEILGRLNIPNPIEQAFYLKRKVNSVTRQTYFLFQAQQLDLPNLTSGRVLTGHIIESRMGSYEPKNIIVKSATFRVQTVMINIPNPFFSSEIQHSLPEK